VYRSQVRLDLAPLAIDRRPLDLEPGATSRSRLAGGNEGGAAGDTGLDDAVVGSGPGNPPGASTSEGWIASGYAA